MPTPRTTQATALSIGGSVRSFDAWSTDRLQTLPLAVLKNSVLGIDASTYLKKLLDGPTTKEPLVPALGGFPFGLRTYIENDLAQWQQAGIKPLFVFSGIKMPRADKPFAAGENAARNRHGAWQLYDNGHAVEAVEAFRESGILQPHEIYRFLRKVLIDNDIEYQIAPYASWAQLVYLEKHPKQYIDAIFGPVECFFYDVEKVITGFNFPKASFSCLNKKAIIQDLGGLNHEQFIDACILSGFEYCSTFPILDTNVNFLFKNSLDMLKSFRNVSALVNQYMESPAIRDSGYLDKYRRARLAIKHQIILTDEGRVEPMNLDEATGDMHEFVGNRLPEEVYFYLSKGLMNSTVLDMLISGESFEMQPLDAGESDTYRLFLESLQTLRAQCLSLLAQPLQHWWNNRKISVTYWYDKGNPRQLTFKDLNPSPYEMTSAWNVKEAVFGPLLAKRTSRSLLGFAATCVSDKTLAPKTVTPKNHEQLLKTTDEIIVNTMWRTLQLRGFIGPDHQLTSWGKVLSAAMSHLNPDDELEEACYLAVELLKAKLLKVDTNTLGQYTGREQDRRNNALVSRVACLGRLRHNPSGYTGPLCRSLLTVNSIIRLMTRSLENLVQMTLISLLMNGDADRDDRKDWGVLGTQLPFVEDGNLGVGVAVKTWLDELTNLDDPTSYETRAKMQQDEMIASMFQQSVDVMADINRALRLWDALIVGIQVGVQVGSKENLILDANRFLDADKWLKTRRPVL